MDYIREFDIRLDKEHYYAGENITGVVILDTVENFKLRCKYCALHCDYVLGTCVLMVACV